MLTLFKVEKEGGKWGYTKVPEEFKAIIKLALVAYEKSSELFQWDGEDLKNFAEYMLDEIRHKY